MSRSNPTASQPNPSTRWFEWKGDKGGVVFYDKQKKANVECKLPFRFLYLDETSGVRGWNEPTQSSIFSNEVRDTRVQRLVVRTHGGRPIANGIYQEIKPAIESAGGHFSVNVYNAYKDGKELKIGTLQLKGAGLNVWSEFRKSNRKKLTDMGVAITGFEKKKNGSVNYVVPKFELFEVDEASNAAAVELDKELQAYLTEYMNRTPSAPQQSAQPSAESPQPDPVDDGPQDNVPMDDNVDPDWNA